CGKAFEKCPLHLCPTQQCFAAPMGENQELLSVLDRWLASFKEDPDSVYHQAIHRYLEMHKPWEMPRWLWYFLWAGGGVLLLLFFFVWLLRTQVALRTRELQEANRNLQEEVLRRREAESRFSLHLAFEKMVGRIHLRFFAHEELERLFDYAFQEVAVFFGFSCICALLPDGEKLFWPEKEHTLEAFPLLEKILQKPDLQAAWQKEQKILLNSLSDFLPGGEIPEKFKDKGFFAFLVPGEGDEEGFVECLFKDRLSEDNERYHLLDPFLQHLRVFLEYLSISRKRAQEAEWFQTTLRSIADAVIATDKEGRVIFMNPVAEKLTGWSALEAVGRPIEEVFPIFHEKTRQPVLSPVRRVIKEGKVAGLGNHTILVNREGEEFFIDDSGAPILDREGKVLGVVLVFRDATERRKMEQKIVESERRYRMLFTFMPDGFVLLEEVKTDKDKSRRFRIVEANASFAVMVRFRPEELRGLLINEVFPGFGELLEDESVSLLSRGEFLRKEIFVPEFDAFWEVSLFVLDGSRMGMIVSDITARKKYEVKIRYLSFHDTLTGLYNRLYAEEELARLEQGREPVISFVFADLDGLKFINDALGHQWGDEMLKRAANILQSSCRREDIVARWGGDEFLVVLPGTPPPVAQGIAERIEELCREEARKEPLFLGLSLGVATRRQQGESIWEAINAAEEAAYRKKFLHRELQVGEYSKILYRALLCLGIEREEELSKMRELALQMGKQLGLSRKDLGRVKLLVNFHDVGKLAFPREVLFKKNALSEEEELFRQHPALGYRIARAVPALHPLAEEIYAFRECWDGSGYPQGKKGEEIPFLSRLVQVVETYLTLTFPDYGEAPLSCREAFEFLEREKGVKFDPHMVDVLGEVLGIK
ncbi:MAG: diguanylate cyclase, partial [Candidatus Atribacteria bacterium]|nr:diguanylate cyclase [Candidatus Atribacteria bacterium]MCD6349657.1 diguanylate cyclase [Candidatus Atribacteria bacterium]